MLHWTPDQVTALVTQIGLIVGGVVTIVKMLHNNRNANDNLANSIPLELAHKMVDNQNQQATQNSGNELDVKASTDGVEVKNTPTAPSSLVG